MIVAKRSLRRIQTIMLTAGVLLGGTVMTCTAGPWRAGEGNTRGWQLMTPQERIEHQARVRGLTDYTACEAYRTRHHDLMAERAAQRGLNLPYSGWDFCDRLKSQTSPPAPD